MIHDSAELKKVRPSRLPPLAMSREHLVEFRLRRGALEQAAVHLAMLQEGYRVWAADIRQEYGIEGAFDVNPETGQIVLRPQRTVTEDEEGGDPSDG